MKNLLTEIIATSENAPVIVLFGSTQLRREQLLNLIKPLGDITVYGTLSEDEGIRKVQTLPKVDLILIGGRYTEGQRVRIHKYLAATKPDIKVTEPGWDYPYKNDDIINDIKTKLAL
ncbi:hypothetical protein GVN16_09380 [Emticicia sp. CRIBPO]|uniref:hypothetical protein n=1 Tax=Emticicia sp. CRIBPO TaxID=2683258 RepID=UPI00141336B3|nr:hypothetical protein [Emticicia sp. CRIBPO]NBA85971.1 hypothetical protein [Emticicia sp. CRIBPO]